MLNQSKQPVARTGQRSAVCPSCSHAGRPAQECYGPVRALYVRDTAPPKPYRRVGWLFERCGHAVVERAIKS